MYINTTTNAYPVSEAAIKQQYPNTSFPVPFVAPEEYEWVFPAPQPSFDGNTQAVREITPIKIGQQWQQQWEVYALDPQTVEQNRIEEKQRIENEIVVNAQKRLDVFAQTRGYDNVLSLCTYATSGNQKFAVEGQYGVQMRDETWLKVYDVFAEVESGVRTLPSGYAEIEPELPPLTWPN